MEGIEFYKQKVSSEYQGRGWSYKSADSNFATTYVSEKGGGYVTKNRWHHCTANDAEYIKWSAPSATTTKTIDDPYHRYPKQGIQEVDSELRQWLVEVADGRKYIGYSQILVGNIERVPAFVKGAAKAFLLEAHRNYGVDSEYCKQHYPTELLSLLDNIEPVYITDSMSLPELR